MRCSLTSIDYRDRFILKSRRISCFTDGGRTEIGLIRPTDTLASLSQEPDLQEVAEEVEAKTIEMIDDAR